VASPFEFGTAPGYNYRINANWLDICYISKLDPSFFSTLMHLAKNKMLVGFLISEIHVCMDTTFPVMEYTTHQIIKGHYVMNGNKPFGYGTLYNEPFEGPVGKQSEYFTNPNRQSLKLDSLYCGSRKNNSVSVLMHDKANERKGKKNDLALARSRIEVRYNFLYNKEEKEKKERLFNQWEKILENYASDDADLLLTDMFLQDLHANVCMTTRQRVRSLERDLISPWWVKQVLGPLQVLRHTFWSDSNKALTAQKDEQQHAFFCTKDERIDIINSETTKRLNNVQPVVNKSIPSIENVIPALDSNCEVSSLTNAICQQQLDNDTITVIKSSSPYCLITEFEDGLNKAFEIGSEVGFVKGLEAGFQAGLTTCFSLFMPGYTKSINNKNNDLLEIKNKYDIIDSLLLGRACPLKAADKLCSPSDSTATIEIPPVVVECKVNKRETNCIS
jgi:hypothetical protein